MPVPVRYFCGNCFKTYIETWISGNYFKGLPKNNKCEKCNKPKEFCFSKNEVL